jgi:RNA polymerase sigma-70 factor, ECF subfamily
MSLACPALSGWCAPRAQRPGATKTATGSNAHVAQVSSSAVGAMSETEYEAMVRAYSSDLFRFAHWLCRNRWQAQDLVQETFVAAWKGRESLRDGKSAKAWLFSILRNEHVRVYQRKRLELVDTELEDIGVASDGNELERVELENMLRALPENFREPLLLQVLGGFSGKEIASMLNLSEENVMTRLTRARQALQKLAAPGSGAALQG